MITDKVRTLLRRFKKALIKDPLRLQPEYGFLKEISGVVHVGANTGQERGIYSACGLRVIWVEPIPEAFEKLSANIRGFNNQRAYKALVTDVDEKEYEFHIANNGGQSSSIFSLGQHKDIWPDVHYKQTITLKSITLARLFSQNYLDARNYQALIMDTQGSELLVLKGSLPILDNFKFIKTEVADFESYEGCCQLSDLNEFMIEHGYREFSRKKFAARAEGGSYFNIVYTKHV
jgi:FkbM family methyltransferase